MVPGSLRELFGFALVPDAVFYLEADLDHLIHRVLVGEGFDYLGIRDGRVPRG